MHLKLDSIILFALIVPLIMTHRLSPSDLTPYWLFGLIFLGLLSYISLDLFFNLTQKIRNKLKLGLLFLLIIFSVGASSYSEIIVRHQTSPTYDINDIIIQQESAIRFLLHGVNPYSTTYFNTPLAKWHYSDTEINPALYHFVMQPFYLIFSIPFYLVTTRTIGFFDGRIPLLFLFFSVILMINKLIEDGEKKRLFIALFAFNPANLNYFIEGRDDIYMFAFLFAGLIYLYKEKYKLAGVFTALAFAIKQSVWPFFPFYFAYLYFKNKNLKKTIVQLFPFAITFLLFTLPFIIWNWKAFFDSTILYLSGNTSHSYPIAGYGFGKLLNDFGFIKNVNSYYPFWIWQILLGFPLLICLILWMKKNNNTRRLIISYGIFLFVFWYFSRYFNNSHLAYLSIIFITAYFWPNQEKVS